ncbi:MAG TPA: glycosyltransferase family 2 protein [Methylomirabilota bacterium]|jgi:glycosyltransferase involved in cell wall biosynthesis|nr:glycosyltransferase family 2 protein [Methylomirabilota bacterium]
MKPLVLIPAFNEAARIDRVLAGVRAAVPDATLLVVDDGSADDTAAVARAAGARVVRLPFNLGAGVAAQTGYKLAVREGYDCVVQLDADGQHEPADIPGLLAVIARDEADVAIGSRFLDSASSYRPDLPRRVGMAVFRWLAWILTGVRFSDVTSGFRAFSGDVVRFVATEWYPTDYADADVLITLRRAGFRLREVPVRMYARAGGLSMHAGLRPIYYVFKMLLSVALAPIRRETAPRKRS